MNKSNDWYSFYEPYIKIKGIFDIDTIVENYIKQNYSKLIEKQFEQYKEQGRYTRAGDFIDKEIKAGLKNPDSYYLELKKGNRKDITDILSEFKKLPLIVDYIEDLKYFENREYNKASSYLRDTLELGAIFLNHPECCHYLLWIFSTTDDDSDKFIYGSKYLETIASFIKNEVEQFNFIDDRYYDISLECYKKFINIDDFLTKENILDLYIKTNYSKILKDEYKLYKEKYNSNQDTFMRDKDLYTGEDDGRFLFNSLTKRKKKLDIKLLKKFRELEILEENNNTSHSQNIEKLKHIRLALQMGALVFQKFPHLSTGIRNAMKNASIEGDGASYLKEFSRQLNIVAFKEMQEEDNIQAEVAQEKYYNDNMSNDEYDMAKLLGFDI
ncbi:hypothetical protein [Streptococcus sp. HMSC076C08]|uniref:hypothetical protein n=1 Tax=Streptococcus sp. HMSC076C08 TaxID=1739270 RepID=UPI0008A1D68D|nr:hypothetical protein [Streptococcus sp. HMSC076C08]OFL47815.1 hypothetical protein HMPREF2766_02795 [Streptococcus sp. HMSC076C08]